MQEKPHRRNIAGFIKKYNVPVAINSKKYKENLLAGQQYMNETLLRRTLQRSLLHDQNKTVNSKF